MYTKLDRIYNGNDQEVQLHGVNWFGFNNGGQAPDGLWTGVPLASDFATVVARMRCLGFNAVRLPFSFKDLAPGKGTARDLSFDAGYVPTPKQIAASCGTVGDQAVERATLRFPARRSGTRCNDYLPSTSTYDRFRYCVQFFANNGFYVLIDNHFREDTSVTDNRAAWIESWASLVADLMRDGSTASRLMVDLLNEPDAHGVTWANGLGDDYLDVMDAIEARAKPLYFIEGAGQGGLQANWGDGFCTDGDLIAKYGLADPRPFFAALAKKPYARRVVLSPHVYGPAVTSNANASSGPALVQRLTQSFGSKTRAGINGAVYPAAIGEMGSTFKDPRDLATLESLSDYIRNKDYAADGLHHSIHSWFYWCWNADSGDTGGLVGDDWLTLQAPKIAWLRGLGL